jgi:hypothetical protein
MIYSIILYDAVAGGAGHVRRLVTNGGEKLQEVIREAIALTKNCTCDPSCYNCLRNYYNQNYHDILSRQEAYMFLEKFEGSMTPYVRVKEDDEIKDNTDDSAILKMSDLKMDSGIQCTEYENWNSLNYIYPDSYAELFADFDDKHIPLPDAALVNATVPSRDEETEILFIWKEKHIMVFDDDQPAIKVDGWKSYHCSDLNALKFSKSF